MFEMKKLSASYGAGLILENVDFKVCGNDFIGVIGPNGGGKTTLLKVILGLLKPVRGELIFSRNLQTSTNKLIYRIPTYCNGLR